MNSYDLDSQLALANTSISCLLFDSSCRSALFCNANCSGQPNEAGCNLLCQLNDAYQNDQYTTLLHCMVEHSCLPVLPEDGEYYVAEDSEWAWTWTHRESPLKVITELCSLQYWDHKTQTLFSHKKQQPTDSRTTRRRKTIDDQTLCACTSTNTST